MRRFVILLLCLVLGVLLAPAAVADAPLTYARLDIGPRLFDETVRIASEQWPESGCRGRERIVAAQLAAYDNKRQPRVVGYAMRGRCMVALDVWRINRLGYTGTKLCTLLVHEFGHLAGRYHAGDPKSVMYPNIKTLSGKCLGSILRYDQPVGDDLRQTSLRIFRGDLLGGRTAGDVLRQSSVPAVLLGVATLVALWCLRRRWTRQASQSS